MKMEIYELLYFLLPQNTFIEAQQGGGIDNFLVSEIKPASVGGVCSKAILIIFHYILKEF